jgi:hypothetical protein
LPPLQNCPVGQEPSDPHRPARAPLQKGPPGSLANEQIAPRGAPQSGQSSGLSQGIAHVPLLSRTLPDGHGSAFGALAQVPLTHLRLQHCSSFLHFFPSRLQPGGSAAASPMPSDASAPPTTAAPINLSALRRESVPLASPLASSSKERLVVCWLTCCPYPEGRATRGLAPPS